LRLNFSRVIPDARFARDRESRAKSSLLDWLWIPGQASGLPGMTGAANGSTGIRIESRLIASFLRRFALAWTRTVKAAQ
jgi:hypothetical protein